MITGWDLENDKCPYNRGVHMDRKGGGDLLTEHRLKWCYSELRNGKDCNQPPEERGGKVIHLEPWEGV